MAELPEESGSRPAAAFPDEPFACPHCGQMLAPSCRVCPSCREAIDPKDIPRPEVVIPIASQVVALPTKEYARFSWSIFFATLGTWLIVALIAEKFLGYEKGQLALGALVALSSVWVFHDARTKNIPTPWRWSLGSFLLWILMFPWYLARRRTPKAPCPFIEGEGGRVARTLLFILFVIIVLYALMMLIKGPVHPSGGKKPAPKGTQVPGGKIAALTGCIAVQPPAREWSAAWKTQIPALSPAVAKSFGPVISPDQGEKQRLPSSVAVNAASHRR